MRVNTAKAVREAFPDVSNEVRDIITGWYERENAAADFSNNHDFADYILTDIGEMLDACLDMDKIRLVAKELVAKDYLMYDVWSGDDDEDEDF